MPLSATVVAVGYVPSATASEPGPGELSADRLELRDDDAASALFSTSNLAPGQVLTNCLTVTRVGPHRPALRMYASTSGTGLDRYLDIVVESGGGGGFEDCGDFAGGAFFRGRLSDLVAAHHDYASGLPAPEQPDGVTTFRFTVALADEEAAQGRDAVAMFTWAARQAQPDPVVTAPAFPAPSAGKSTVARERAGPDPVAGPAGTPPVDSGAVVGGPVGGGAGDDTADTLLSRLAHAAARLVSASGGPMLALLWLAVLFLAVQDRLDRNDPKLRLAPVYGEPDLPFAPFAPRDSRP